MKHFSFAVATLTTLLCACGCAQGPYANPYLPQNPYPPYGAAPYPNPPPPAPPAQASFSPAPNVLCMTEQRTCFEGMMRSAFWTERFFP